MEVHSSRFGKIDIPETEIISFPEGLLGFENETSFCILDSNDGTYLLWLQSTNNPNICFPILEPAFFIQDFEPNLMPADLRSLKIESVNEVMFYSIVTIPDNIKELSANLKAPIALNHKTKTAKQIVLQDNKLDVSYPIYTEFKRTLAQMKKSSTSQSLPIVEERISHFRV